MVVAYGAATPPHEAAAAETYDVETTVIELGEAPNDLVVDETRGLLYVSNTTLDEVVVIDLATKAILDRHFFPEPAGLEISSDGAYLYVALNASTGIARVDLTDWSSTQAAIPELGDARTWDVVEISPGVVLVAANPGSFGFAYIVKYDFATGTAAVVADGRIIRSGPRFALDPGAFAYIGESGESPNSLYKLDLGDPNLPIVLEDPHGGVSGAQSLAISPDGGYLVLGAGQKISASTFTQIGSYANGLPVVDEGGNLVYVVHVDTSHGPIGPITLEMFNAATTENLETWTVDCGSLFALYDQRIVKAPGAPTFAVTMPTAVCIIDGATRQLPQPEASQGCTAANDPQLDGFYWSSGINSIYAPFVEGERLTFSAGLPADLVQWSKVQVWVSGPGVPGGTISVTSQTIPGTVTYDVPTDGYYNFSWDTGSGQIREATWAVSCIPPGTIAGTVTAIGGTPVPGVCVYAFDVSSRVPTAEAFPFEGSAITAADGTYSLKVPPSSYLVGFFDCETGASATSTGMTEATSG